MVTCAGHPYKPFLGYQALSQGWPCRDNGAWLETERMFKKKNRTNISFPKKEVGRGKTVTESGAGRQVAVQELWVPRGHTVSVGRTQSLPRLHPSACLAAPSGHLSQVRLAAGRAPYGCL